MQALDLILGLPMAGDLSADPAAILRGMMDRWLPDFFRPMACRAVVGGVAFDRGVSADVGAWPGETIGAGPGSRRTGPAAVTFADLADMPSGDRHAVRLTGGLRFIEPALSPEPEWYGRALWRDAPGAAPSSVTLAYVQLHWNDLWREIRLSFPALGFPLSGRLPQVDKDGLPDGVQPEALVARNRERLVGAFMRGADAIGFARGDVSWSVEAEADTPRETADALRSLLQSTAGRA